MYGDIAVIVVVAGLNFYGIYIVFKGIKKLYEYKQNLNVFKLDCKNKYEHVIEYYRWVIGSTIFGVICLFEVCSSFVTQNYTMFGAYSFVFLYVLSVIFDSIARRQMYYSEKTFYFDGKITKYRSIINIPPKHGIIPLYSLFIIGHNEDFVSKKIGEKLIEKHKEFKARKKNT